MFAGTVFGAALLLGAGAATAQIVTNGGFETGDFTGWSVTGPYACVSGSFNSCFSSIGITSSTDPGPHSGDFAAYLGGNGPDDVLSQALTTTAGQGYYLQFFMAAPDGNGAYTPNNITISWDGITVDSIANLVSPDYAEYSFWVSGAGSDTLSFDAFNANSAFVLDDVSVVSAPEPAALSLLIVGMAAVGVASRRRNRRRPAAEG